MTTHSSYFRLVFKNRNDFSIDHSPNWITVRMGKNISLGYAHSFSQCFLFSNIYFQINKYYSVILLIFFKYFKSSSCLVIYTITSLFLYVCLSIESTHLKCFFLIFNCNHATNHIVFCFFLGIPFIFKEISYGSL